MILGMSTSLYTTIHVILSLIGIVTGLVVFAGMLTAKRLPAMTALFLTTTILTSLTGFPFPTPMPLDPAKIIGLLSLVVLAVSLLALYANHLVRSWRWIYVVTALFALYLNCFVAVVQSFQKIPFLHALAPKGSEPPFAVAQLIVLVLFVAFGYRAVKRFHPGGGEITMGARMPPPRAA